MLRIRLSWTKVSIFFPCAWEAPKGEVGLLGLQFRPLDGKHIKGGVAGA